ncbi:AAA family ATPase [Undibacterium seohonense]|uniref:AAA family ATPase n=1 Tax=Undibacterium seohonense TaxID=1344950 RepID=A0ABR6WZ38_9BURK|nr:UvrD-helicase domain-containing protein [Undibacterium seohonense]MBC3805797.1 AAA family ATPase [Undibacterium seohonense]
MSDSLPNILAGCLTKGYVIAPAGFGKTHLIALAVKEANSRQLILTHTFAGVNSVKAKMVALKVPSANYQVDTIASWALRLCLAYPKTSGWKVDSPNDKQWHLLYKTCQDLLSKDFIRHVVTSTYKGIYVDEYQDCSNLQHGLVCVLAEILPCRVLGDPLQAIFDFADKPVDWAASIYPHFNCLGQLETPWRWNKAGAPELGAWLNAARATLEAGDKIDLSGALPKGIIKYCVNANFLPTKQYSVLCGLLNLDETVIALHGGDQQSKNKTHLLARTLAGKFSSIEEVEGKALFTFIRKLEAAKNATSKFLAALEFAKKCITGVGEVLVAKTKRGEIAKAIKSTKPILIPIMNSANLFLVEPSSKNLRDFLYLIINHSDTHVYRRDLLNRFINVLKIHIDGEASSLVESAEVFQRKFRHAGRPIRHTKLIGTTLLVKGLEYDHAVLLEADKLDQKELYVAMTRGAKSLTIICTSNLIPCN